MAISSPEALIDTICALSTPPGRSAIALIRLSGPKAFDSVARLSKIAIKRDHRTAQYAQLFSQSGEPLDEVVVTYFESPKSFTGEELVEIACHGNPEIVKQILSEFVSHETRMAEAGEFSRRAVANGKMSLAELEALAWLIEAKNPKSISSALRSKFSGFGVPLEKAKEEIEALVAEVEARLDFPEHEVDSVGTEELQNRINALVLKFEDWLRVFKSHKRQFTKPLIVIAGPPNSGKSSLFNRLLGLEKSIVFNQPGTTRDQVEAEVEIDGRSFVLVDTAGIHETNEAIEMLGIEKTHSLLDAADLVVWVSAGLEDDGSQIRSKLPETQWISVSSKSDERPISIEADLNTRTDDVEGFRALERMLIEKLKDEAEGENLLFSDRQAEKLQTAIDQLRAAQVRVFEGEMLEWVAEALRGSFNSLEEILGEIPHQSVLDKVLSKFCIGK